MLFSPVLSAQLTDDDNDDTARQAAVYETDAYARNKRLCQFFGNGWRGRRLRATRVCCGLERAEGRLSR